MLKRIALALTFSLALAASAVAQSFPNVQSTASIPIAGTVAASTRIVTAVQGRQIIVTSVNLVPVATASVLFTYGTGTNCGTGTVNITGTMVFSAGQTLNLGSGLGGLWVLPQNVDLCVTIATAAAPGSLAYSVFAQ